MALGSLQIQPEAYEGSLPTSSGNRKFGATVEALESVSEALGSSISDLNMPGNIERDGNHEGPQVKLRLYR